ncbi:hypothetical protein [Ehrlichia japonica]|uniref:Uncharacterized protein n=1 Tax=Ehrlichia japonica TaxID=391036 RepID=X5H330_9RICK|nr:hypothetical protein [Ehrlichia japonica]AHX04475.1 hypothetical protein EHF_0618 [Ehrlichia japonica]
MLGSKCLERKKQYNSLLCEKLSSFNSGLKLKSACVIGSSGPNGRLRVRVAQNQG